jgi:hypothetical protein
MSLTLNVNLKKNTFRCFWLKIQLHICNFCFMRDLSLKEHLLNFPNDFELHNVMLKHFNTTAHIIKQCIWLWPISQQRSKVDVK